MEIAATMTVLVVLTLQRVRRRRLRIGLVVLWVAIALLVGVDRIFVGAHYPTDVIAGFLLGTFIAFAFGVAVGVIDSTPRRWCRLSVT